MKYAVIDIGSNSVRLMLCTENVVLYKIKRTTRLAEGMGEERLIKAASAEATFNALSFFSEKAKVDGAEQILCFATSAVRTASNGSEFVLEAEKRCNINIDVVSEETEAEIGFLGAMNGKDGGIIDIGGGSTEIRVVREGKTVYCKSIPVGAVRLYDECGNDAEKLRKIARDKIKAFGQIPSAQFVGIGGTCTSVASILIGEDEYDPIKINNFVASFEQVKTITDKIINTCIAERKKIKGLEPERADIIGAGLALLYAILEHLGATTLRFSDSDNLEGYYLKKIKETKGK